jgi:starch synthase
MRVLLLCEGDAESPSGFSGSSKSIVDHLRAAGDHVVCANCDLLSWERVAGALPVYSPARARWASRYHLSGWPFRLRSRKAKSHFRALGQNVDVVLQIGATFRAPAAGVVPYFNFCDSNIRVAQRGSATGHSLASPLTADEIDGVARREAEIYRGAAGIFPLSEYLRRSFIDDFGAAPDKVVAVGGGPNLDATAIEKRIAPPAGPPTILFVGAGFHRKGADLLLRAFERVRTTIHDARLIMIGIREPLSAPGVESLGFLRKDVPSELARLREAYRASHVFCLPTRFEPYGIVYIEAMSYGLPCVGPEAWAVPEMVLDGRTGFTFPPEDDGALAERLIRLLSKPELAFQMGEAGHRHATTNFTWRRAVDLMRVRMLAATGKTA